MQVILQWTIAGFALLAAVFWLYSALMPVPEHIDTPMQGKGSMSEFMRKQARYSAFGAGCAAVSALATVAATLWPCL